MSSRTVLQLALCLGWGLISYHVAPTFWSSMALSAVGGAALGLIFGFMAPSDE